MMVFGPRASRAIAFGLLGTTLTAVPASADDRIPDGSKVTITSCVVMFAARSSGVSNTREALFDDKKASQVKVTRVFEMDGVEESAFQRMTDRICGDAAARLTAAGYEVVPATSDDAKALEDFQKGGKESPINKKLGPTNYLGYAPSGSPVLDPALVSGLGQFKHPYNEARVAKQAGAQPIRLMYTVEFASVTANDPKAKEAAIVTADMRVSVGAVITTYDHKRTKCYKGISGREACENNDAIPGPNSKALTFAPDTDKVYSEPIVEVKEGGNAAGKVALGAANALAAAAGTRRQSYREYTVTVDPAKYEAAVYEGAASILPEAIGYFKNPTKGKKK